MHPGRQRAVAAEELEILRDQEDEAEQREERYGHRATLLIVRELLTQGPCRYTDLRAGLPGIASNLLSTRLKEMETAGLITRTAAPPPIAATLFDLTAVSGN